MTATERPASARAHRDDVATLGQRDRILDAALELMASSGYAGMSMRRLADASGCKVSTIYHYFPSKQDLLREVIGRRSYEVLMRGPVPVDSDLAPRERLVALLRAIWQGIQDERPVWRLLIGESQRGDPDAVSLALELLASLEQAIAGWLASAFSEVDHDDRAAVSSVVIGQLLSFLLEDMLLPEPDRAAGFERRAAATAALVFPERPRPRAARRSAEP